MTGKALYLTLFCMILMLSVASAALCAQIDVSSIVNPTKVPVNERITLTVRISGPDASNAGSPILETTPDFTVTGPLGQSTEIEINNGRTSTNKSFTYYLLPTKIGTSTVGAVTVKVGNQSFSAPGTKVEVVTAGTSQKLPSPPSSSGLRSRSSSVNSDNVFIRTFVDKKTPCVGEQVILTFELYNQLNIFDTEYSPPTTTGFWAVKLPEIPPSTRIIENRIYQINTIKTALFPTTSGELTIGPAALAYSWGDGFFSRRRSNTLTTEPITIEVKPLSEEGKPDTFNGSVGNFSISSSVDKTEVNISEVVSIKVSVTGNGNLDLITSVNVPDFSAFKTYDPKVSENISNSGFVVGGTKTWEFVIIPRSQGEITLDPFSITFFNPGDESYHTVSTAPIKLRVSPGEALASDQTAVMSSRKTIENIATDIRYIKPDKTIIESPERRVYANKLFYLTYFIPFAGFVSALLLKRRSDAIERNTGMKRRINAWKNALKRLANASKLLTSDDTHDFCGSLSDAVVGYIGDMLNIETGTLTSRELEDTIMKNGISSELAERTRKNLELCDFTRFSSSASDNRIQENLLKETQSILNELKAGL
ncbi:BatD family protein [Candidatus Latescibacterota bacterium]